MAYATYLPFAHLHVVSLRERFSTCRATTAAMDTVIESRWIQLSHLLD